MAHFFLLPPLEGEYILADLNTRQYEEIQRHKQEKPTSKADSQALKKNMQNLSMVESIMGAN